MKCLGDSVKSHKNAKDDIREDRHQRHAHSYNEDIPVELLTRCLGTRLHAIWKCHICWGWPPYLINTA